jgi:hypothetical protein
VSRHARRVAGLVAALVACGPIVAACGGGGGTTVSTAPAAASPAETAIRGTVLAYISAFLHGQGGRACALLTVRARHAFLATIAGQGVHDCATAFRRAEAELTERQHHLFDGAHVENVQVSGNRATADLVVPLATVPIRLAFERGAWRIANLPPR